MATKWTKAETNHLILLVRLKFKKSEIVARLPHRTKEAIHGKLKRLGLKTPRVSFIGVPEGMKRCSNKKCENSFNGGALGLLPATKEFFHSNTGLRKSGAKKSTDGLYPRCKMCKNQTRSKNYFENSERDRNYQKEYRATSPDKVRNTRRKYYKKNRNYLLEKAAKRRSIPENAEKARKTTASWYAVPENKEHARKRDKRKYEEQKLEEQIKLIEYFKVNAPEELHWEKKDLTEKDLQMLIVHKLIHEYKLEVYWEVKLSEKSIPDIYIPKMDLLLEVKATKRIWTKKHIIEQVRKYREIEECWIICLDRKPKWATENLIDWVTPKQLFDFLDIEILGKPILW